MLGNLLLSILPVLVVDGRPSFLYHLQLIILGLQFIAESVQLKLCGIGHSLINILKILVLCDSLRELISDEFVEDVVGNLLVLFHLQGVIVNVRISFVLTYALETDARIERATLVEAGRELQRLLHAHIGLFSFLFLSWIAWLILVRFLLEQIHPFLFSAFLLLIFDLGLSLYVQGDCLHVQVDELLQFLPVQGPEYFCLPPVLAVCARPCLAHATISVGHTCLLTAPLVKLLRLLILTFTLFGALPL